MYKTPNTIEYNSKNGSWELTFPKSFKDVHSIVLGVLYIT